MSPFHGAKLRQEDEVHIITISAIGKYWSYREDNQQLT